MKTFRALFAFALFVLSFSPAFGQTGTYTCPQYQSYNGAGACVFTNYTDTPAYLKSTNAAIAASLNQNVNSSTAQFAKQYGSLLQNQQQAIMACQVALFDQSYFGMALTLNCPVTAAGALDVATLVAQTPGAANPANLPSVSWNGSAFVAAVAPTPAAPTFVPNQKTVAGTNLVGAQACPANAGCIGGAYATFYAGPGAMLNSLTPAVTDGQMVTENGQNYIAHVVQGLFGVTVYFTASPMGPAAAPETLAKPKPAKRHGAVYRFFHPSPKAAVPVYHFALSV